MFKKVKYRFVRKRAFFSFGIMIVFCLLLSSPIKSQIFSEAPVTISDKGERLSNMIYVKVKSAGFIELQTDNGKVDGRYISNKFLSIRKSIAEFCEKRQIDLRDLEISKAIPSAKDEDTLFVNATTGEIRKLPNLARVFIIHFPKAVDIEPIIYDLEKDKEIEFSHGPVQLVNCAEYPNDQYYASGDQWYLDTINAPNAWGITKGKADIKVGLIETSGVELTHTDLQSKIAGGDNNPAGLGGRHGTWVAGFAGAVTNNTTGVASLGWDTKLFLMHRVYQVEYI